MCKPLSGSVTQNGSMVGAVADYSCVAGYRFKGPMARSCMISETWTFNEPICKQRIFQSACLVINPITVDGYAALLNCTTVDRASDLKLFILVGWDRSFRMLLGPPGLN